MTKSKKNLSTDFADESKKRTPPKKGKGLSIEIGDTGNEMYAGIIYDEYNSKLRGTEGIKVFDEMRRSDGTVKAALLSITLPIMRANWYVKPASEEEADKEVSDFVQKALFDLQSITWADLLRQALLMLPFGVMVFEKIFDVQNVDGSDRVIWRKLAPRLPKSIQSWEMSNGQPGIQQRKLGGTIANIPMDKLLVFVHEREGDNWEGSSALRAAYKHWHLKNTFYKIDAIAFERQGLGVPYAKMPAQYTEEDRGKAETILKNMRANEQSFVISPNDYEIGFLDMKSSTTRDPEKSISHHNREISKSVLAQFLELGSTDSGSRALSQDQTKLFLQSLESVANNIADVFNKYAIKELVDYNFPNVEYYPELCFANIKESDVKAIADTYKVLTDAGGVHTDPADEQHFREMLGLPERTEEYIEEPDDVTDDVIDEIGMSEHLGAIKKKVYPSKKQIASAINASLSDLGNGHRMAFLKRNMALLSEIDPKDLHYDFLNNVRVELSSQFTDTRKISLAEGDSFKGFRALTFAEKKVDFSSIEKNLDGFEGAFDKQTQALLNAERERYIAALSKAVNAGDREAIKAATVKVQAEYAKIIKDSMRDSYEFGKKNAAIEIGQKVPASSREILNQIDIQANAIAELHAADISNSAKTALVESLNKGESSASSIATADAVMAERIATLTRDTSRIAMSAYVNYGRDSVFENYKDKIYGMQRSELLDLRTCNYCLSVDGRVVSKNDSYTKNTIFHSSCRGIWVSILLDEAELPTIGGIPKSLRDRFGDAVNDLIQPKEAQTKKDSAARKEEERRAKREANRKKKS
mgnify:CR=1 FL=1